MNQNKIIKILELYEPKSMRTFLPIVWKKAKKEFVWDINNKKYIDFTSTIFVMNTGHSNKRVKKYIKQQMNKNLLHSYIYPHEIRARFIKKIISMVPSYLNKAFLLSSGTEATEASVKLMKWYTHRSIIISFKGSMHGRTLAAEYMKGSSFHKDFLHLPFPDNNSDFLKDLLGIINPKQYSRIAGFMIETYQGWSARFLPIQYIQTLCNFATQNGSLICFDEIQSGLGRTGHFLGSEYYNVETDLVCLGKGLGGGLPLSAVIGRGCILDFPNAGDMSSTHSANPLCCAGGLAVLDEINNKHLINQSLNKGIILHARLELMKDKFVNIIDVAGKGLLGSIIFQDSKIADDICKECCNRGLLLVHTGKNSIKIGPPLCITEKNLIKGLDILEGVMNDYWH